ncbi:GNAT family acetyltransferase [Hymenobacter sp. DG25B]|jgi:GNAT superfamily N-acetyltransferase|uniref:GNAT family N-acetyltransferase n=1 Tax=Hymenobacter sp. DG25B TaxID=1385664 RepID=UPI0005412EC7|nr:GNAT family N-acetyltransferase [Hymenobacter sp. DG25B]AIZ62949.1 GNAT family acetyltransferase [Hymenobacter sp. DG25B]
MTTIRRGTEADLPRVRELILELAEYERAPHEVTTTLEDMRRDGFGPQPIFGFFVAETPEAGILGIALYYTAYSTWKGRMLYLEDLVVTEAARGMGLGKLLFDAVVAEARATGAHRLKWQVLEWNEPAIGFYKRIGANLDPEWHNGNMSAAELQAYVCHPAVEAAVRG